MSTTTHSSRDLRYHLHPYTNLRAHERDGPLVIVKGDGVHVIDEQGNRYLEGMAGLWCASLGFSNQRLADAAYRQMRELPYYHSFNGKVPGVVTEVAERLIQMAPGERLRNGGRVIFANSGSECNDTAFKLVRYYHNAKGLTRKKKILTRVKGYHGVTMAAASLSGIPTMHKLFDLPIDGVVQVGCPSPYAFAREGESDADFVARLARELEETIAREGADTIGAMIAEPVQGAGGVLIPAEGYFKAIVPILRKHDILLIADEVICGFGRLGTRFGSEHFDFAPDMLTCAKQITSAYVPFSALMVSKDIYEVCATASEGVGTFGHGYTYSGHPLGCAVALEAFKIYEEMDILSHVRKVGARLQAGLRRFEGHPIVGQARGIGLIGAVELSRNPARREAFDARLGVGPMLVRHAQTQGLILRAMGDTIAFSPPLIISEEEVDTLLQRFEAALALTLKGLREQGQV